MSNLEKLLAQGPMTEAECEFIVTIEARTNGHLDQEPARYVEHSRIVGKHTAYTFDACEAIVAALKGVNKAWAKAGGYPTSLDEFLEQVGKLGNKPAKGGRR